jgi:hypothetical protein
MSWMIAPGDGIVSVLDLFVLDSVEVFPLLESTVIVGLTPHSLIEVQLFNKTVKSMTHSNLIVY